MNRKIAAAGAAAAGLSVVLFAVFMLLSFDFGSYFVCMVLAIGFVIMTAGFCGECTPDRKAAAYSSLIFAAVYAVLVLLVYFAQTTTLRLEELGSEAGRLLGYSEASLFFNYDLLGYGIMALSTFFTGLTLKPDDVADKVLKWLLILHGVFFFGCFILPMTGAFITDGASRNDAAGVIALESWCVYFAPVCVLSMRHFVKSSCQ